MIYVDRGEKVPPIFDDGTVNRKETDLIINHYKTSSKPFDNYEVYKKPEVKQTLIDLFHYKCAYCESIITNHPADVEHFRPKNQVKDADKSVQKPGYYWLAADWNNLYLSCIDCNRRRYHEVPGEKKKMMLGKLDQFPLKDKSKRWEKYSDQNERDADESVRLLIDPCKDDPELYLSYTQDGLILPVAQKDSDDYIKASESIRVYALRRKGLVDERRRHYTLIVKVAILDIIRLKNWISKTEDKVLIKEYNDAISEKLKTLLTMQEKEQPYSGMIKFLLKEILPGLLGEKIMEQLRARNQR